MLLAIDVGNSNIEIGCLNDGCGIERAFRLRTDISKTDDEYAANINSMLGFHSIGREAFGGAIISSVVPPITGALRSAVKKLVGLDTLVVGAGVKTGLNILIDDPAQLGGDIVAAAVAAAAAHEPPVIVVDMGTATKIMAINKDAGFIGGAIFPGVALSMNALSSGTSQLPKVNIDAPRRCISANTVDCMKSGAIFGNASMVDGMIDRFEEELGAKATTVATGGLAGAVYKHCKHDIAYDPHLVLRGLGIIYSRNVKK
ncbi:MAG: type III pantothenate kinase [Oscillospiraceae bacterium]|nr:type III pantothenate kinase [Oscillospiraceae bacterium]